MWNLRGIAIKDFLKKLGRDLLQALPAEQNLPESLWNLRYENSDLTLYGVKLQDLLREFGSPLHLLDWSRLDDQLKSFQLSWSKQEIEVFYSYKTNPLVGMLRRLHQNGAGAEVISGFELWLALQLGVPGKRIIYNGPGKSDDSIEQAINKEILLYNFNHAEEIPRVQSILQRMNKTLRVGLRVVGQNGWSGQLGFGMDEAVECYRKLLNQAEFDVQGLHSHRGFLIESQEDLTSYLQGILNFVDRLHKELGWVPKILDLGGSLAVPTVRYLKPLEQRLARTFLLEPQPPQPGRVIDIESYGKIIIDAVGRFCKDRQIALPQIVIEPGRALTSNVQMLLTQVMTVRHSSGFTYAVMDAGTAVADPLKSEFHQLFPLTQGSDQKMYRLVGPICHMGDVLFQARKLPKLKAKDGLVIMDSGAYFLAEDRSFSFPRPGVVGIDKSGAVQLIRRNQEFSDIIHRDKG